MENAVKSLTLAAALTALALPALAHEGAHGMGHDDMPGMADHKHAAGETGRAGVAFANPDVVAQVNGLVCDFCAKGLEKSFKRTGKVTRVLVDLTAKEVRLKFKPDASLDDTQIRNLIRDAGYVVVGIKRPAA